MNIFDLRATLTLDTSGYKQGIEEAKTKTKEVEKTTEKTSQKSVLFWTAVATAVVGLTAKFKNLVLETANYADSIGDLAGKWGFTTKEIQEFDYWASQNGTTLESLLTGMRGLVNQAEAGSQAFKKLGISVKNSDGSLKDQKQLFLETIDALKGVSNQTERNALQFEIFGRAGIELGDIINKSSTELENLSNNAEEFGLILSEEAIQKTSDFNDVLDRLKTKGKVAFAELITGAEGATEKFDEYLDTLVSGVNQLIPYMGKIGEKLGSAVLEGFFTLFINKFWGWLRFSVGEGWLWGEKFWDKYDSVGEFLFSSPYSELIKTDANQSIFNTEQNSSESNSNYEINIEMKSTSYTKEDAKILAEEVIKEIATKKQASGR